MSDPANNRPEDFAVGEAVWFRTAVYGISDTTCEGTVEAHGPESYEVTVRHRSGGLVVVHAYNVAKREAA